MDVRLTEDIIYPQYTYGLYDFAYIYIYNIRLNMVQF